MAVFSTNLVIYAHTDFEQTFLLEDNQSNSAKNLTGFTGTARFKRQFQDLSDPTAFNISFPNRTLGKVRIGLTATQSANVKPGKYFYEIEKHKEQRQNKLFQNILLGCGAWFLFMIMLS